MWEIRFSEGSLGDIESLRVFDQRRVMAAVSRALRHEPDVPSRRRKLLRNLTPPFAAVAPVWQLTSGDFRVFYDLDGDSRTVYVRAVRRKPPHATTEEIL